MKSSTKMHNFLTEYRWRNVFSLMFSMYLITLAFFCKTVKTLSAPVTGLGSIHLFGFTLQNVDIQEYLLIVHNTQP